MTREARKSRGRLERLCRGGWRAVIGLSLTVLTLLEGVPAPVTADGRPSLAVLRNATIRGIVGEPITLQGGTYEGAPFQAGAASRLRVTLWTHLIALGELEDMPEEKAAVLLDATAGGSGSEVYVAVFQTVGGHLVNVGTALVGDRIQVRALAIADRRVTVDVVEAAPGDALCCPSRLARKSYALRDGALTLVSSVVGGALSLTVLAGTTWILVNVDEQPQPQGARPPTIVFRGAWVSGFGGCNDYMGQVTETAPGAIVLGPLAVTKMACPSPAREVEDRYLAALAAASRYAFIAGRLVLNGRDSSTSRRLTFEQGG